jgi:ABC-2 type transporter
VAEDLEQGFFDRLRSLPIPRASVMAGRGLADTALLTWGLAVATALGFVVGVRTHGSVTAGLAAFGLCVLFSFAFEWLFITIGLVAGNAQAAHASLGPVRLTARAAAAALARPSWRDGPDIRGATTASLARVG